MDAPSPPACAVVGAGPAGLAAAETLAKAGHAVTVFERMPSPARKLLLAGRGGLNLTHSEDLEAFLGRYGAARGALEPALRKFSPQDLRAWADALGQETFVGSSGRVFPKAFKASPLLRAWLARLGAMGVELRTRRRWIGWDADGALLFSGLDGPIERFEAEATILALGGASWPRLGSDGQWVDILRAVEIDVAPMRPANCGFEAPWSGVFRERFQGEPLKRIALSFQGRVVRGEALVTRYGLEGGAIYALSAPLREAIERDGEALAHVDLRPDVAFEALAARLSAPRGSQSTATFLRKAASLSPVAIGLLREAARNLPTHPAELAGLVKAVPVRLVAPRPIETAISSAGGVRFSEVDDGFMLRKRPGVFVAGEMLDWEAPTGGYLLQASIATGIAAADGAAAFVARNSNRA